MARTSAITEPQWRGHVRNDSTDGSGRALFLAQLPPPDHGQSAMAATVFGVLQRIDDLDIVHRWRGGAASNGNVGKRTVRKYLAFAALVCELLVDALSGRRYRLAYVGMAPWSHTALRDALLAGIARLIAGRVLLHVHGEGLQAILAPSGIKRWLMHALLRGTELLAITEETARAGEASALFSRVVRLPNTVADPGAGRRDTALPLTIGCLANLDRRKGVLEFVDSIADLVRQGYPVRGVIVGGETAALSLDDVRAAITERGAEDHIIAAGQASGETKSELLRSFDVFLYLSRHDLAPLALIEALAHGAAPIVFDIGGLREMVGPKLAANVLDPDADPTTLQRAINHIVHAYCTDTFRLAHDRESARERFLEAFTSDQFAERFQTLLSTQPTPARRVAERIRPMHTGEVP